MYSTRQRGCKQENNGSRQEQCRGGGAGLLLSKQRVNAETQTQMEHSGRIGTWNYCFASHWELLDVSSGTVEKDRDSGEMICGQEPVHISKWVADAFTLAAGPRIHHSKLVSDGLPRSRVREEVSTINFSTRVACFPSWQRSNFRVTHGHYDRTSLKIMGHFPFPARFPLFITSLPSRVRSGCSKSRGSASAWWRFQFHPIRILLQNPSHLTHFLGSNELCSCLGSAASTSHPETPATCGQWSGYSF